MGVRQGCVSTGGVGTGADRPRPSAGKVQRPGVRGAPEVGVSVERRGGDATSVGRGAQSQKCEEEGFVAYIPQSVLFCSSSKWMEMEIGAEKWGDAVTNTCEVRTWLWNRVGRGRRRSEELEKAHSCAWTRSGDSVGGEEGKEEGCRASVWSSRWWKCGW